MKTNFQSSERNKPETEFESLAGRHIGHCSVFCAHSNATDNR